MDKSWIEKTKTSPDYISGVENFVKFSTSNVLINGKITCPCFRCGNKRSHSPDEITTHLLCYGFLRGYKVWFYHGERPSQNESSFHQENDNHIQLGGQMGLRELIYTLGSNKTSDVQNEAAVNASGESDNVPFDIESDDVEQEELSPIKKLMKECDDPLYPNCKTFTVISFVLHIWNVKTIGGWSGKSLDMLFEILKIAFPEAKFPSSWYEAKKLIKDLGLGYEKIHACPNNCMLFWGENAKSESCKTCGSSRWGSSNKGTTENPSEEIDLSLTKKKPAKVLCYFPLIPRLRRMYMSKESATSMRWHANGRTKDGVLRHPADALAWKSFDERYPDFASDPRNVRLGLASDGLNPFGTMSTTHSTWPVILVPYNREPWLCMKKSSLILSTVIPGSKGPGNDIDIFLQPLIAELKQLWAGVDAYDALRGENFTLRATLMWTINDFPAYANLSGWNTRGRVACPVCAHSTESLWLDNGGKYCYMCHRRWLEEDHVLRYRADQFDSTVERRSAPIPMSGVQVFEEVRMIDNCYGKNPKLSKKRTRDGASRGHNEELGDPTVVDEDDVFIGGLGTTEESASNSKTNNMVWKKRSIFFELPYWQYNLLRHNLDVMHIEKNVCDNVIGTLLNLEGKTKDNEKARLDLQTMGIRPELHPVDRPNMKPYLPQSCYTMTLKEKELFLTVLKNLKIPDGYASNISRAMNLKERKISNLKSHDCHVLMQYIFPLALRGLLVKHVVVALTELSAFFRKLCSKTLCSEDLDELQKSDVLVLCHLEKIFPPEFFTIMVHLIIHLPLTLV